MTAKIKYFVERGNKDECFLTHLQKIFAIIAFFCYGSNYLANTLGLPNLLGNELWFQAANWYNPSAILAAIGIPANSS